jgi:replication-associated recombination protein RarA
MTNSVDQLIAPTSLDDFAFSRAHDKKLLESILKGKLPFPMSGKVGFCFWGGYGTGKTTLAQLLPSLLEASGALSTKRQSASIDTRGGLLYHFNRCGVSAGDADTLVDIEARANNFHSQPTKSGWNYEIIDEVDLMQSKTQAALKSIMTTSTATIFLLTTNHLDKIDGGVRDRCHLIELNAPTQDQMISLSGRVLRKWGLTESQVQAANLRAITADCRGSWRQLSTVLHLQYTIMKESRAA